MKTLFSSFLLLVVQVFYGQQTHVSYEGYQNEFWKSVSTGFGSGVQAESTKTSVFATNLFIRNSMSLALKKSQLHLEASLPKYVLIPQPSDVNLSVDKAFKSCDLCPKCDLAPWNWGGCFCDAATLGLKATCEATNAVVGAVGGLLCVSNTT